MKAVLFTHPRFLESTSMPIFASLIAEGLRMHGVDPFILSPRPFFFRLPAPSFAKKWLGYLDQFLVFPIRVRWYLRHLPEDTLFIFSDQAQGPWVPLVADRPHVIHCHDFLALRSALGEVPQNPTSWTGRIYQRWIRSGFRKGRNFISVSNRTKDELQKFLGDSRPAMSVVIHNGLNHPYVRLPAEVAQARLASAGLAVRAKGFILHVGGNQWYKNRDGVLAIYSAYVERTADPLPLVMIGAAPTEALRSAALQICAPGKVEFLVRPSIEVLEAAYSTAAVLLFPSYAEGFGWPILEAMACGSLVLVTNDAPMTEVGGDVARYLPVPDASGLQAWAEVCANRLGALLACPPAERNELQRAGIARAASFSSAITLQRYFDVYRRVLENTAA